MLIASNRLARSTEVTALLIAVGDGSEAAFAELYDLTAPMVHGISRVLLHGEGDAEQATEAVFLRLWRQAPRYRPDRQKGLLWILVLTYQEVEQRRKCA